MADKQQTTDLASENERLREAVRAFFAAPVPPGRYTVSGPVMVVGLAAAHRLREALGDE